MSYHKLVIVGNLGRDPEMSYFENGDASTKFSVASNRSYTRNDEKVTEVTWFNVNITGKQAEACAEYLHSGSQVLVEGELRPDENGSPRIWQRSNGEPAASYDIRAFRVVFLGSRPAGNGDAAQLPVF